MIFEYIMCSSNLHGTRGKETTHAHTHTVYGFRKGHSCETQLTTVINDWAKILDNRGQVDTFILGFENTSYAP